MPVQTLYVQNNLLVSPLEPEWSGMAALQILLEPLPPPLPLYLPTHAVVFA